LIEIIKKAFMKKSLLFILFLIFTLTLQAQKDTTNVIAALPQKDVLRDALNVNVTIYPIPVRENSFTIKTDKDVSFVRITNIIGQDIFRIQYNVPQQLNRIVLNNPKRGMYLVTILFSDGTRVVKKIMVEESE
jgi:Secretion system C-terminal sorting domain